jgi:hypothetical protein
MGEMADWAYDQMICEAAEHANELDFYLGLDQEGLMNQVEAIVDDENYESNEYTDMVLDIYMASQSGYKLTDKQLLAVGRHLVYQRASNWY